MLYLEFLNTVQACFEFQVIANIRAFTKIPADFPAATICKIYQFNNNNSFDLVKLVASMPFKNFEKNFNLIRSNVLWMIKILIFKILIGFFFLFQ